MRNSTTVVGHIVESSGEVLEDVMSAWGGVQMIGVIFLAIMLPSAVYLLFF